jgi:hypothetical protein
MTDPLNNDPLFPAPFSAESESQATTSDSFGAICSPGASASMSRISCR